MTVKYHASDEVVVSGELQGRLIDAASCIRCLSAALQHDDDIAPDAAALADEIAEFVSCLSEDASGLTSGDHRKVKLSPDVFTRLVDHCDKAEPKPSGEQEERHVLTAFVNAAVIDALNRGLTVDEAATKAAESSRDACPLSRNAPEDSCWVPILPSLYGRLMNVCSKIAVGDVGNPQKLALVLVNNGLFAVLNSFEAGDLTINRELALFDEIASEKGAEKGDPKAHESRSDRRVKRSSRKDKGTTRTGRKQPDSR